MMLQSCPFCIGGDGDAGPSAYRYLALAVGLRTAYLMAYLEQGGFQIGYAPHAVGECIPATEHLSQSEQVEYSTGKFGSGADLTRALVLPMPWKTWWTTSGSSSGTTR